VSEVNHDPKASIAASRVLSQAAGAERTGLAETKIPLLYVDSQALTRDCIASQLAALLPEFLVATFAAASEIKDHAASSAQPCSLIYHTHAVPIDEPGVARGLAILHKSLNSRIILLSDLESTDNIMSALRRGVMGYIPTSLSLKAASDVIRFVHTGGTFIPAKALSLISHTDVAWAKGSPDPVSSSAYFTPRQTQVLTHLWEGKQNKIIAYDLDMSESTVKVHVRHIMKKLHASNRTQAVLLSQKLLNSKQSNEADNDQD
jgi:DNA-binding NarL/FixJ family response regulator